MPKIAENAIVWYTITVILGIEKRNMAHRNGEYYLPYTLTVKTHTLQLIYILTRL